MQVVLWASTAGDSEWEPCPFGACHLSFPIAQGAILLCHPGRISWDLVSERRKGDSREVFFNLFLLT